MKVKIKTLETRFVLFLFLPVTLLLVAMGIAGFIFARNTMLAQWEETAVLRLKRAAHFVDMRLSRPKELLRLYLETGPGHMNESVRQAILDQLRRTAGVLRVELTRPQMHSDGSQHGDRHRPMHMMESMGSHNHVAYDGRMMISSPHAENDTHHPTVTLVADSVEGPGQGGERMEVVMDFDFLIEDLSHSGWWETRRSFLVDSDGRILVANAPHPRAVLGDTGIELESRTLAELKSNESGTLRGPGHPPDEIGGFYRLMQAPWYLVVYSPGKDILTPIVHFRNAYFICMLASMFAILVLIRRAVSRTTDSIKLISVAADGIAGGRFSEPLPVTSRDEIGDLIYSFNTMTSQLQERSRLKQSLNLAKEVQQNLIPASDPDIPDLDVAGRSEFCEETGGDYYDFIYDPDEQPGPIRVVIGDVAGHGIASALLMSGVRASFRQRNAARGSLAEVIGDVNRQVVDDVGDSGQFMTLFCLEIDGSRKTARWVRAGHEPGLFYRRAQGSFDILKGEGIPLGVSKQTDFHEHTLHGFQADDLFLLGTDGIWEAVNPDGEMFGRQRFEALVRKHANDDAKVILAAVFEEIKRYTHHKPLQDDITLVVVKLRGHR